MNLRAVSWIVGCVLMIIGVAELAPFAVSFLYHEPAAGRACLDAAAVTWLVGTGLIWLGRGSLFHGDRVNYFRREGLATVGISWLAAGVFGALPYMFAGVLPSPVDAVFETVSGFTTTGASVLTSDRVDALPRSIAFWRCMTNWLGGVGIVMVFVLFLPSGARNLYRAEVTGLDREASGHRVRDSAMRLFRVYIGLSLLVFLPLVLAGLDPFDATLHTFATVATGGFSSHGASAGHFGSWVVECVLVAGMFLAGVNFDLYNRSIGRRDWWRIFLSSTELRVYAGIVAVSVVAVGSILWLWGGGNGDELSELPDYRSFGRSMLDSAFALVSLQTTTGFATADFDRWPDVCRMWIMTLGSIGGCAGSTAGGLKVVRIVILWKAVTCALGRFANPRALHEVRIGGRALDDRVVSAVVAYLWTWLAVAILGTLVLAALGHAPVDALAGVLATLNNLGPGLGAFGPTGCYAELHGLAKGLLTALMLIGRLEFYAIVSLLLPTFWRT